MTLVKTDLGFLRIVQNFKIVGRETNNNKVGRETNNNKGDSARNKKDAESPRRETLRRRKK